ncbi:hypothetical protein SDC9_162710 [bioreactor metagenome]|uniref:Uncharacterized protein n=1 Tax=bioreactor metagenome TaxID=1076179 RepID=A0A645FLT5_9ZZZZ
MFAGGVIEQADVGQDDCIDPLVDGAIDGGMPVGGASGLREGVDRHQHFAALGMGVTDTFRHGLGVEVEASEIAGIGIVFVAEIDGVGAVVDSGLEGGKAAGGTDEIGQGAHGRTPEYQAPEYSHTKLHAIDPHQTHGRCEDQNQNRG